MMMNTGKDKGVVRVELERCPTSRCTTNSIENRIDPANNIVWGRWLTKNLAYVEERHPDVDVTLTALGKGKLQGSQRHILDNGKMRPESVGGIQSTLKTDETWP
jgi:hypothetical protein